MARLLVIVPVPVAEESLRNREAQGAELASAEDLQLAYRAVKASGALFDSFHDYAIADLAVLEAGMHAQEEGFDAVCVDTISDSGVNALRSLLDIPVVGPGRAAYLTALMLGDRFSVLTVWEGWSELYGRRARELGLADKLASVRAIGVRPDLENLLGGKEEEVFPKLVEQGLRCVEEDGADVVCLGSTTMHQAAAHLSARLPVPVVNPGPASYAFAQSLLALGLTHSRRTYQRAEVPKPAMLAAMLDAAAGAAAGAATGAREPARRAR